MRGASLGKSSANRSQCVSCRFSRSPLNARGARYDRADVGRLRLRPRQRVSSRPGGTLPSPPGSTTTPFRATDIPAYLNKGGSLKHAQQIAAHERPRSTKLYGRTNDELTLDEIERIQL